MKMETKYDIGQRVWSITRGELSTAPAPCPTCEDGTVLLGGERFSCPRCAGKRTIQVCRTGWYVDASGAVGDIRAEYQRPCWDRKWGVERVDENVLFLFVHYMLDSTGVGSGKLHEEPNLWPSHEEAQAECDRRNGQRQREGSVVS